LVKVLPTSEMLTYLEKRDEPTKPLITKENTLYNRTQRTHGNPSRNLALCGRTKIYLTMIDAYFIIVIK